MARDVKEKLYEIDSKQIELEFLQQQFLVECKRFIAQSMEGRIRQAILSCPEKVIAQGKKGLTPIKEKANQFFDDISEAVEKNIGKTELWLHTRQELVSKNFPEDFYAFADETGPQSLNNAVKELLSPVGLLLLENGLDTEENWEVSGKLALYRHSLEWNREMQDSMKKYSARFNELAVLVKEYEILAEKSAGNEALDLWDSI